MSALLALLARMGTMCVSLVCGVLTTRLVISGAGVDQYVLYTVLLGLPALLSFTDLGSGAVIVNTVATSRDPGHSRLLVARLTSVGRIQLGFAAVAMAINAGLLVSGGWRALLGVGDQPGADVAAFVCMTVFCLAIPLGVWIRVLIGLGKNHIVILVQGLISPLTLLFVWLTLQLAPATLYPLLAVCSFLATALTALAGFLLASWLLRPALGTAVRHVFQVRRYRGARVMDIGWPMLAQLLTPPIAISTQRFVLAQQGTPADVAQYGVAGQVFFALQTLVTAAGVALWPIYAKGRHEGTLRRGPWPQAAVFGLAAAAATGVVCLVGPLLFAFVSDGAVVVSLTTMLTFGAMITATAVLNPLGMYLMDREGIRFQVIPTLLMAFGSLGLSLVLSAPMGAAGPPLGNAIAMVVCQIIPYTIYILRHRARLLTSRE
ncbi:hypothetical protein [Microbacterium gorillae]|uniref:hypothetical protein n=1 Tax=Microbacterium gorillae TaxID=1231063 RepID=UPI0012B66000|nr:hypothetical protein [Microbacterium gorillae]